ASANLFGPYCARLLSASDVDRPVRTSTPSFAATSSPLSEYQTGGAAWDSGVVAVAKMLSLLLSDRGKPSPAPGPAGARSRRMRGRPALSGQGRDHDGLDRVQPVLGLVEDHR